MTIEAETLVQLTEALKKRGMRLLAEINFIRAPYRRNHRWVCCISLPSQPQSPLGLLHRPYATQESGGARLSRKAKRPVQAPGVLSETVPTQ